MTQTAQVLHINLEFSRELVELPNFADIAKRKFNRELGHYVDTETDTEELLEIERIRTRYLRDLLAEREAELTKREAVISELTAEIASLV